MKKALSFAAIALMIAGTTAYACNSCGCESKKADKEKTECGSSCDKEKSKTACGGSKKGQESQKTACGGSSHKGDDHKKTA